jgi:hypothetical protein
LGLAFDLQKLLIRQDGEATAGNVFCRKERSAFSALVNRTFVLTTMFFFPSGFELFPPTSQMSLSRAFEASPSTCAHLPTLNLVLAGINA